METMQTKFSHHVLSQQHEKENKKKKKKNKQHWLVLESMEVEEKEMVQKKRKILLNILRLKACHEHNVMMLECKKGQILLTRRNEGQTFQVEKYGPCPNFLGWLLLTTMQRHQNTCPVLKSHSSANHCKQVI